MSGTDIKDPFYQNIFQALESKRFDPLTFEACMCDLLRGAPFDDLVPVPGGSDSGTDGAFADGKGEAYPLITTTGQNVIGNLTRSLDSYLKKGGRRRKAVLATSVALTPKRRRNLEERAREKGFVLCQVVEQLGIADRLYRSPHWCKELLGLAGTPPALSIVPLRRRPHIEIELIGRDADLEWLRTTAGDRVLSGQPGAGKTFLLQQLVKEGGGLFLTSDDHNEIANALRSQQPRVVIVDDAHQGPELLIYLRHLRESLDSFSIIASTWISGREAVARALEAPDEQCRQLELLTREQILEIYRQAGVDAHDDLLRELVDQASNKPGLAATLARFWLRGSWRVVLGGKALSQALIPDLRQLMGKGTTDLLAALGIGGEAGMVPHKVGKLLGLSKVETREIANGLATGGVLFENGQNLVVRPDALRSALLSEVFFSGSPTDHNFLPILELAPDRSAAIVALVTAARTGAQIPKLQQLIHESDSIYAWQGYAALGEQEARWALTHYPGSVINIAREALDQAAPSAIEKLLVAAANGQPAAGEPAYSCLRKWLQEIQIAPAKSIRRRQLLMDQAERYLKCDGDPLVAVRAFLLTLTPICAETTVDPGLGKRITDRYRLLPVEQLSEILSIWKKGQKIIGDIDSEVWSSLSGALLDWIQPGRACITNVPADHFQVMQEIARVMLQDLALLIGANPSLATGLSRLASKIGHELEVGIDGNFDLIFPDPAMIQPSPNEEPLRQLARRWSETMRPAEIADCLATYQQQADLIGHRLSGRQIRFCELLATEAPEPIRWLDAFLARGLAGNLFHPLLERIAEYKPPGWQRSFDKVLAIGDQSWAAIDLILRRQAHSGALLSKALELGVLYPQLIETLCLRREIPLATLKKLLQHPNRELALTAAIGEWAAKSDGKVRPEIEEAWRQAILDFDPGGSGGRAGNEARLYWMEQILRRNPDLEYA